MVDGSKEKFRIPEGTQTGTKFTIKNKGFKFDDEGYIDNYNEKLLEMEKNVYRLQEASSNASDNNALKKQYEDASWELTEAKKYLEEYCNKFNIIFESTKITSFNFILPPYI